METASELNILIKIETNRYTFDLGHASLLYFGRYFIKGLFLIKTKKYWNFLFF